MFGSKKTQGQGAMALYAVYDRVAEEAGPCFLGEMTAWPSETSGRFCATARSWPRKSTCCTSSARTIQNHEGNRGRTREGNRSPMVEEMKQLRLPGQEVMNVQ